MVTQTHNTQRSAGSKLDHHTSPASIARKLQELADAFTAMGDVELEPTLLSVGLQVVGTEIKRSWVRVATVAAIAEHLGMTPQLSETPTTGEYHFHAGTFVQGPSVYTVAVGEYPPAAESARAGEAEPKGSAPELLAPGVFVGVAPAGLKAVAATCCGQPASACFEVYMPREGEARGRLDGTVHVCDEHPREVAAAARAQELVPYLVPLSKRTLREPWRCGDGYNYVAGDVLIAPAADAAGPPDSAHRGLVSVP